MNELLSETDLEQLTGAKRPAKQQQILLQHGIYFITRLDGSIVTTWHHVNHPAKQQMALDDEPDFSHFQVN